MQISLEISNINYNEIIFGCKSQLSQACNGEGTLRKTDFLWEKHYFHVLQPFLQFDVLHKLATLLELMKTNMGMEKSRAIPCKKIEFVEKLIKPYFVWLSVQFLDALAALEEP